MTNDFIKSKIKFLYKIIVVIISVEIALRIAGVLLITWNSYSGKIKSEIVILSIGESTTYGMGVDRKYSYSMQLELLLNNNLDNKYRVINKGVPAQTSASVLRSIDKQMLIYKPDLVIALLGANDFNEHLNRMLTRNHFPRFICELRIYKLIVTSLDYFNKNIHMKGDAMVSYSRDGEIFKLEKKYRKQFINNYSIIIKKITKKHKCKLILMTYISPYIEVVNEIIRNISLSENVYLVNFNSIYDNKYFINDNWHPNKQGHQFIASRLNDYIIRKDNNLIGSFINKAVKEE